MKRYYCPDLESKALSENEAHHCLDVMRQQEGETITVFDGKGREWKSVIESTSKKSVQFKKLAESKTPKSKIPVILAQALTKQKSMDLIIQKATELGVAELVPLQSDRSVAQIEEEKAEAKVEKWRQTVVESCKQCGQNWLPVVGAPTKVRDFLSDSKRFGLKLIASLQAEARPLRDVLKENSENPALAKGVVLMIGPEGDFTPAEINEARNNGFLPVSLGPVILRSETAALFSLGAVLYEYQG